MTRIRTPCPNTIIRPTSTRHPSGRNTFHPLLLEQSDDPSGRDLHFLVVRAPSDRFIRSVDDVPELGEAIMTPGKDVAA